jgi:hypothetical protein
MKNEYIAEVLPDGHLSLPPKVAIQLNLKVNSKIRVRIIQETDKYGLSHFCGRWQDDRSAKNIISEIYSDREKNSRSDIQIL